MSKPTHTLATRFWPAIHSVTAHPLTCDWHLDQYPFECTCGAKERLRIVTDPMERCDICGHRHIEHERDGNLFPCPAGNGVFE